MADLLGGQVDLAFDVILTTAPYIAAGKLVPLAVTSAQRSQTLPRVPTMAEAGSTASWPRAGTACSRRAARRRR